MNVPIAGLIGHRILVHLSLETLFNQWDTASDNDSPTTVVGKPANRLFEAIFAPLLPLAVEHIRNFNWKAESEDYARRKLAVIERSVQGWRDDIRRNESEIEDKTWAVASLVAKNERLREAIANFHDQTLMAQKRKAVQEHAELMKLVQVGTLQSVTLQGSHLGIETHAMDLLFDGISYHLGPFHVTLGLQDGTVNVLAMGGARKADGYCHPHVAGGGTPCLGNMGPLIAKSLGTGNLVEAVMTIVEFLRSYNHGGGYVDLRRWDPDWEDDDDRYDSCYDNSASHDCVVCGDEGCPYRDGCENRCWENSNTRACIECGDCSYRDSEIQSCRDDHEPWECTECTTSCPWAGDVQACRDTHDGERCKECPVETCKYHRADQKDEECGQTAAVGGAA